MTVEQQAAERVVPSGYFAPLSRTGELWGLGKAQLVAAGAALAPPLWLVAVAGDLGAAAMSLWWAVPVGVLAVVSVKGRSLLSIVAAQAVFAARAIGGQTAVRPRLRGVEFKKGRLEVPGSLGERSHLLPIIHVDQGVGAGGAYVYDAARGAQTATAVLRVDSESWLFADDVDKARRAHATSELGKRLAGIGGITRVAFHARTYEGSPGMLPAAALAGDDSLVGALARLDHEELVTATAMRKPLRRDLLVTITLSQKDSQADIDAFGGGQEGLSKVLSNRVGLVVGMLEDCGARFTDAEWLGAAQIRGAVRLALDPGAAPWLEENGFYHPEGRSLVVDQQEFYDHLRTNTGWHRTYFMEQWPTTETEAGFLYPLIADGDIPRTVTQIWQPETIHASERRLNNTMASRDTINALNGKLGRRTSISHRSEGDDLARRQAEMQAGHPDINYSAFVTVHARSLRELDESDLWVQNSSRGIRMSPLNGAYKRGFATAALPLGYRDMSL